MEKVKQGQVIVINQNFHNSKCKLSLDEGGVWIFKFIYIQEGSSVLLLWFHRHTCTAGTCDFSVSGVRGGSIISKMSEYQMFTILVKFSIFLKFELVYIVLGEVGVQENCGLFHKLAQLYLE